MPLTLAKSGNPLEAVGGDLAIIGAGVIVLLAARRARGRGFVREMRTESLQRGWSRQVRISWCSSWGCPRSPRRRVRARSWPGSSPGCPGALHESDRLVVQFSGVANGFFVPLFFVLLGAELNLRALLTSPSRIVLAIGLVLAAVVTHVIAARVAGHEKFIATGLAASAQLGMPAAAASLV